MIVGLGANSVDFVCTVPAAPAALGPLSKLRIEHHRHSCGGQIATTLSAVAHWGLATRYLGAFGNDANAVLIRAELERRGIDLSHAVTREAPNQFAVIIIDASTGERIVLWDRDERLLLADNEITPTMIAGADLVHVDDVDVAASTRAASFARALGIPVTTDIDRAVDGIETLIQTATHPIFSEHVVTTITGESDPERALRKMRTTHRGILTVTLGAHGAMALEGDTIVHEPGFVVMPVDTTGAGDIFRAGFIFGLRQGWQTAEILRFANAAAAESCTKEGAIGGVPDLATVTRRR